MENLRWILIFAGVAILVLLYFSGRGQKVGRGQSTRAGRSNARGNDMSNNEYSQLPNENADPLMGEQGYDQGFDQFADPSFSDPRVPSAQDLDGFDDPDDFARPGAHYPEKRGQATESKPTGVTGGLGSLSRKIEAFSDADSVLPNLNLLRPPKKIQRHTRARSSPCMLFRHLGPYFLQQNCYRCSRPAGIILAK